MAYPSGYPEILYAAPSTAISEGSNGHLLAEKATAAIMDHAVHAVRYGVRADGSHDDSAYLQNAINAAAGRPVILPPGDIVLASPVACDINDDPIFWGYGPQATRLRPTTVAFSLDTTGGQIEAPEFRGLSIYGGTQAITITGSGVCNELLLDSVWCLGQSGDGLYSSSEILGMMLARCSFSNYEATSPNYGVRLAGDVAKARMTVLHCRFRGTAEAGFYVDNGAYPGVGGFGIAKFITPIFESNSKYAFYATGRCNLATLENVYLENNGDNAGEPYIYFGHTDNGSPNHNDNCAHIVIDGLQSGYDLAGQPQPQVFVELAAGAEDITLRNIHAPSHQVNANGADVYVVGPQEYTINGAGAVYRLAADV